MHDLFGNWSPPEVRGFIEFKVTASSNVDQVIVNRRVTSRRQFEMTMAPCPEVLAEAMGTGMGSLIHINPIELGRRVDSWTQPAPKKAQQ